jgi:hypothetical protein
MLPSKMIPETSGRKSHTKVKGKQTTPHPLKKKVRRAPIEMEEVEDEDSTRNMAALHQGFFQNAKTGQYQMSHYENWG